MATHSSVLAWRIPGMGEPGGLPSMGSHRVRRDWSDLAAAARGSFIAIQAYLKKQERNPINNLTVHLKQLEKEEMKHPRVTRRKEIIKIRAERNAKKKKKRERETIAKINKANSWFFEKINKLDKPLLDSSRNKGRRIKSIKLEMKMEKSQQTT